MAEGSGVNGERIDALDTTDERKLSKYRPPGLDFEGWYLVDAIDGRRWFGKVIATGYPAGQREFPENSYGGWVHDGIPLLEDELVLLPAFEVPPDRAYNIVIVPQAGMVPNPRTGLPEQGIVPAVVGQRAWDFTLAPLATEQNGIPPQRVRRCSISKISDWDASVRANLRKGVDLTLGLCKPQNETIKPSYSGPREKVR